MPRQAARQAIAAIRPAIALRRLRMRSAAGRHFADVVIGVLAERRRSARVTRPRTRSRRRSSGRCRRRTWSSTSSRTRRTRSRASVRTRRRCGCRAGPGDPQHQRRPRRRAHRGLAASEAAGRAVARRGARGSRARWSVRSRRRFRAWTRSRRIWSRSPRRPRAGPGGGIESRSDAEAVTRHRPRAHRRRAARAPLPPDRGRALVFLTLGLDPAVPLAEAHARASEVEERIMRRLPGSARSSSTPSRRTRLGWLGDEAVHVQPEGARPRARLARPDRGRPGDPARGADAPVVLHRRGERARARRVPARRGRPAPRPSCTRRPSATSTRSSST